MNQQPTPGAGPEPKGRKPQFTVVTRERYGGKKWQRLSGYGFASAAAMAPIVAVELGNAALRLPLAFLQEGGRFILAAVLSVIPAATCW